MAGPHTPCPPQSCGVLGPGDVARHGRNHDSRWRGPLLSAGFIPQSGPGLVFHTPVVISLGRVRPPWRKRSLLGSSGIYRDSRWFIQPRIFGVGCGLTRVDRLWSSSGACVAPGKEGFCWVLLARADPCELSTTDQVYARNPGLQSESADLRPSPGAWPYCFPPIPLVSLIYPIGFEVDSPFSQVLHPVLIHPGRSRLAIRVSLSCHCANMTRALKVLIVRRYRLSNCQACPIVQRLSLNIPLTAKKFQSHLFVPCGG